MQTLSGNWIDLVILLVFIYFASEAWRVGFWVILADFLSFLLSLLIALRGYQFASGFIRDQFEITHSLSNALGFLFTAVIAETMLGYIFILFVRKIPYKLWKGPLNKILALGPAAGEAMVLSAFILTLVIGLPLSPKLKEDVADSMLGSALVEKTTGVEVKLNEIFGGVIEDSLTYLTIKPNSDETISINVGRYELAVDENSEKEMFKMVNKERRERGVRELEWAPEIVPVARSHAMDMWQRQYFGHVTPDGKDVGNRLDEGGVGFLLAGENLALAPTLETAHTGLMNSEGHRTNILEDDFGKLGIGVIDNGIYGKMFVQVFTN